MPSKSRIDAASALHQITEELIGLDPSWGMALITIAGVVTAVVLMRFLANRMAHQERFTPIVKRIVRPHSNR